MKLQWRAFLIVTLASLQLVKTGTLSKVVQKHQLKLHNFPFFPKYCFYKHIGQITESSILMLHLFTKAQETAELSEGFVQKGGCKIDRK